MTGNYAIADNVDIPTALTEAERNELKMLAHGANVLEVGSLLGHSTVTLAQVAQHVVSIDPHEGYPASEPRPTFQRFMENLERYGVRDKVTVIVDTHDKVVPWLQPRSFELVFIDATGEYDLTLDIIRSVKPLVNSGWIAVHDCGHPDWPGALQAVESYGRPFDLIDRLAIIQA